MRPPKLPTKVGAFVLAIGGVSATITADTAREWLDLLSQYGPLVLSVWLIYLVYHIDKERTELKNELYELRVKVVRLERDSTRNAY